mmetsp:Transcript_13788/g.18043  ORF Transcript_13788/g.18043 Transcript_13788/m.18043 type:complete len:84 (+) Transcript_13788:846-1097(+)
MYNANRYIQRFNHWLFRCLRYPKKSQLQPKLTYLLKRDLGVHVPFTYGSAKRIEHKMNMIADGAVRITEQLINDCCLHHMQLE